MRDLSLSPSFRPDIEGLRAIAVLLVVACHACVPGLAGGYIGVDVFFVISGFLITRLLLDEKARTDRIDVLAFYARRMRRLLPAFTLMLLATTMGIRLVYAPIEQPDWFRSGLAATLYFSNLHFAARATDYMAPAAKLDPFLHTWSLGVEEQFYLAWPLLLLAAAWWSQRRPGRSNGGMVALGIVTLASLAASLWLTTTRQPLAFFMPFTRAWEFGAGGFVALGAGALLASGKSPANPRLLKAGLVAGMAMLLGSAILLPPDTPFPGIAALLPVSGTALLILVGSVAPSSAIVSRLLGHPSLQWLGRLSYGWYLWHWPLLVIGRTLRPAPGLAGDLLLAGIALLLAQLSYTLVEHPIRMRHLLRRVAPTYLMALVLTGGGVLILLTASRSAETLADSPRFHAIMASLDDVPAIYKYKCDSWFYDSQLVECKAGASQGTRTMVLLGDSHAGQWFSAAHSIAVHEGLKLVVMTKSACPIIDQDYFYDRLGRVFTECREWREKAVARIQVIRPALLIVSNSENYNFSATEWRDGLQRILPALADSSGHLVVMRDTPAPGFSAPECLARHDWSPVLSLRTCTFDPKRALSPMVWSAYQTALVRPNMALLDMTPEICREHPCQVRSDGVIKFRDSNHLTDSFVRQLTGAMASALGRSGAL